MKNGRDYTPFQGKKMEWKESDTMNSITCATQKDNLIMIKQLNPSTESNSGTQPYQQNRIYDSEGEVPALSREKADLLIATNNSKGYEIANIGYSINYSVPSSKTRRGRVGKQQATTIDVNAKQAVVVLSNDRIAGWHENENVIAAHMDDAKRSTVQEHVYHKETGQLTAMGTGHVPNVILTHYGHKDKDVTVHEIVPTLKANSHGHEPMTLDVVGNVYESGGQAGKIYDLEGISPVVSGQRVNSQGFLNTSNIRRLTEVECERLQGFPDDHTQFGNYDGVIKKIPKTQRYKLMGNAVTVDIVALVASRIKLI